MAAALINHALQAQGEPLRSLRAISAGVAARDGEPVSENSVMALRKVGLDISRHRSQELTQELIDRALVVFCMTEAHRAAILRHAHPTPDNIYLFREFMPAGSVVEIADPYGCALSEYEASRDEMVEAIPSLMEFLKTRLARPAR